MKFFIKDSLFLGLGVVRDERLELMQGSAHLLPFLFFFPGRFFLNSLPEDGEHSGRGGIVKVLKPEEMGKGQHLFSLLHIIGMAVSYLRGGVLCTSEKVVGSMYWWKGAYRKGLVMRSAVGDWRWVWMKRCMKSRAGLLVIMSWGMM